MNREIPTRRAASVFVVFIIWLAGAGAAIAQPIQPVQYTTLYDFATNGLPWDQPVCVCVAPNGYIGCACYSDGGALFQFGPDLTIHDYQFFREVDTGNSNAALQSVSALEGPNLYGQVPLPGGLTLTTGTDGNFYGTMFYGSGGYGELFMIQPGNPTLHPIHDFPGAFRNPVNVIQASDGTLYGTTWDGKIFSSDITRSNLSVFIQSIGGYCPSLIQGSDGMLYGTVLFSTNGNTGDVFRIGTNGNNYLVLTNLPKAGLGPSATIMQGSDGYLYLAASEFLPAKGQKSGVCQLNTDGTGLTLLHEFNPAAQDGALPIGLSEGPNGTLYGTTVEGGTNNMGTLYKMRLGGSDYQIIHNFGLDGAYPMTGVTPIWVPGVGEVLYGSTAQSVTKAPYGGTFFSVTLNLSLSVVSTNQAQFIFSWPGWANGFVLQHTASLTSQSWITDGSGTEQFPNTGEIMQLVITNNASAGYYRLVYPPPLPSP